MKEGWIKVVCFEVEVAPLFNTIEWRTSCPLGFIPNHIRMYVCIYIYTYIPQCKFHVKKRLSEFDINFPVFNVVGMTPSDERCVDF